MSGHNSLDEEPLLIQWPFGGLKIKSRIKETWNRGRDL